jgi:tetratricopeptide (TPR) repeat protein
MMRSTLRFKCAVAVFLTFAALVAGAVQAQTDRLDELFVELRQPDLPTWQQVEDQIWAEWSRSGSPAMDLLLDRGRKALEGGDYSTAIEHFTALTDHAPEFAEGYNGRATAYFQADMYGPALRDIETTLALNPRHFGAMAGLALILEELEFDREALSAYRAVAAIHPHRPNVKEAIERLEAGLGDADT